MEVDWQQAIGSAWQRRQALHDSDTTAYRLFHGWTEGERGIEIDRYGELVLIGYRAHTASALPRVLEALDTQRRFDVVLSKTRRSAPDALRGSVPAARLVVREGSARFLIEPWRVGNPGLFLDAREARRWITANSASRRVLNLFAFAGSLGIAAAVGGAREVVHVDTQASALELCRANHELNELPIDDRCLMRVNLYQHLRKLGASRQRFDGVIIDAPPLSFFGRASDNSPGGRGPAAIAPLVARMLTPGGWMLCLFHDRGQSHEQLERAVLKTVEIPLQPLWRGTSGLDFPEDDPTAALRLSVFARPS